MLGAYLVAYAVLSLLGGYQNNISSLDDLGIITRGMPDREEWQPVCIRVTQFPGQASRSRANAPGYLFLPLVLLDRTFCHPTKSIT
jgi:hypothetical protein